MANILVTIISEQTIQNVLFIKQLTEIEKKNIDKYIFFSSKKMFDRHFGKWVADVCRIRFEKIEVQDTEEDDMLAINSILAEKIQNKEDNYFVNITGGTKLMSTALYEFFSQNQFINAKICYLPVGKNTYIQLLQNEKANPIKIEYQLSVEEYLNSYGVNILKSLENPLFSSRNFTDKYIKEDYHQNRQFFNLRALDVQSKEFFAWNEIKGGEKIKAFLQKINFIMSSEDGLKLQEVKYLAFAGEIEELVYHRFNSALKFKKGQILMGVEIDKEGIKRNRPKNLPFYKNDNELDIVFIYNNTLYVVECKRNITTKKDMVSLAEATETNSELGNEKKSFNDIIYTIAAIKDNKNGFGLHINTFLYCHSLSLRNQKGDNFYWIFQERAELHNVVLSDRKNIDEEIKKLLPKTT